MDDTLEATREGSVPSRGTGGGGHADALERGTVVGRYVVLSLLGAGGMGVVYAAFDPELDRKVALKLLLPGKGASEGRTRLLREAQALGKLQHPNVVTVHDVGTYGGSVWLAMELVEGKTLAAWQAEKPRRWSEVLEVMVRAGRGVSAAHAAGLLHRDLKPDNIMVGDDGRVRVMDFGLARARDGDVADASSVSADAADRPEVETLALRVTRAGALVGTPAYMAPEQLRGAKLGPATDQFSFCVTLWEALHGMRPFTGDSIMNLVVAVLAGSPSAPLKATNVPGWLRRALERGLSVAPDERWPSMDALLDALQRGHVRARRRRSLVAVGLFALCVAGFVGWRTIDRHQRIAACEAEGASISEVWNDAIRSNVRGALLSTGAGYAETTADNVMPWLDDQASAWQTARTRVCLDAKVHGIWDARMLDRGEWCLDERRMGLEALVAELALADAEVVRNAVTAAADLRPVDPCGDTNFLTRLPSPPKTQREDVRVVRAQLSRVDALEHSGKYDKGLELVRTLLESADGLAWPPLWATIRSSEASLLARSGAYEQAEQVGAEAYYEAARFGAWDVAARASTQLVYVVGLRQARHAEGLAWGRHAEIALAHAGDVAELRESTRLHRLGNVHWAMGAHDEARALYERALAIKEKALGAGHPNIATILNNLAIVASVTGVHDEARALYERALAIKEKTLGTEHPDVASSLNNLALLRFEAGSYDEVRALHARALAIREKALGTEHPDVAASLSNLANVHNATGAYDEAQALYERALSIREKALGPEHPEVASGLRDLASIHRSRGAHDDAQALYERALAIHEKALGPEHPEVATSLNSLALVHYDTGAYEDARALAERALVIQEKAFGAEHPGIAASLSLLASIHHRTAAYEDAQALYERALSIQENALGPQHPHVAASLANLALVHFSTGAYEESRALYERALSIQEKALGTDHPEVATSLVGLAEVHRASGDRASWRALLERAVAIYDRHEGTQVKELDGRFALAEALVATGGDRVRARRLAEQARDGYRDLGERGTKTLAAVQSWLAANR